MSLRPALTDEDRSQRMQALIDRQIDMLGHLAEVGLDIAMALRDEVTAGSGDKRAAACAFDRVSRAVRLSLMMQEKLLRGEPLSPPAKAERPAVVERAESDARPERGERLDGERLDRDVFGDLLHRPVSDVIAHICRDLGVEPDWDFVSDEAWAEAEIFSGEVGKPFKGLTLGKPLYFRKHPPPGPSP